MERAMLEYLANALWQLPVLGAGAWVLLWLMKPGPRTQYRIWLTVLAVAVLLPAYGIRGEKTDAMPGSSFEETTARIVPAAAVVAVEVTDPMTAATAPQASQDSSRKAWRLPLHVQRVHLSATAVHWVVGVYASSVLLGLLRVVRAWRGARRLVETSRKVALCSAAETVLRDFSGSFEMELPEVRECAAVTSPMVVGAVSPVVLLPEGFAGHADDEVRAALLHELAHVKRRDYLMNGICQLAVLPVGWHPVAYGVQRRIRRTREMVCDEMAAREMESELGYARCLLTMARRMLSGGLAERPEFVGLFSNNVLEERVMRLMETKTVLSARAKLARMASGATAMAAATLVATSFHVVPTMAAECHMSLPEVQAPMLQDGVFVPLIAPETSVQTVMRPVVAPTAPTLVTPMVPMVAPAAPVLSTPVRPAIAPVAAVLVMPSVPAMAAPFAVSAPQSAPAAPTAPGAVPAAAPVMTPVAPEAAPVAPSAPMTPPDAKKAPDSKRKNSYIYRMTGPDGDDVAIVNGEMRALTPEEKQKVEKAMADSKEGMRKAMEAVTGEKFQAQMAAVQQAMEKVKIKAYFDTDEFNKQMDTAQHEIEKQSAWMNSAEFRERMAKVQAMVQDMDIQICTKDGVKESKDKQKQEKLKDPKLK